MQHLSKPKIEILRAVALRVVPETAAMDETGWGRFEAIVDRALSDRTPAVRRQIATFLGLIRVAPVLRWGRPFHRLPDGRRDAFLRFLQDGPASLLRQGFWGLKALVFMGYYGQHEVWPEIGYDPSFDALPRLDARA